MTGALNLHPKVAASLLAGYLTVIIVYSLHQWAGVDLPDTVSAAVVGVITFIAGWIAPDSETAATPASTSEGGFMAVDLLVALVAIVVLVTILASQALGAKPKPQQHYANFGPWCVSLHDGTPRFIATKQACYSTKTVRDGKTYWPEVRVKHQRIPLDPTPGPRGPAGPAGKSIVGPAGKGGQSVTLSSANGCVTLHAIDGDGTVCDGKDGTSSAGAKGDKGDPGQTGRDGTNGRDGKGGLGDGLRWFCWDGQHGHGFADGGDGSSPDCNGGTKAAIQVVTVGPVLHLK